MTDPLTPVGLDLRDFPYMPLDVVRLRDAEITVVSSGDGFRAAVLLWCSSWHQVPAASLPDDDRLLAVLAGYGRDLKGWAKVRAEALHGFIKCCDGRLYHPVIADKAIEADGKRRKQQRRTVAATVAAAEKKRNEVRNGQRNGIRNGSHDGVRYGLQEKGREGNKKEPSQEGTPLKGTLGVAQ